MKEKKKQLSQRWRYDGGHGALVWQMMFTEHGDLIGQKRFASNRQTLYFCIEPETGKVLCDNYLLMDHALPAGDGWFTGLETTWKDFAYCYACLPLSPEHKGVWAIDFRTGKVVWSRSDIGFVANLNDKFLVSRSSVFGGFPERTFLFVDPLTGSTISQHALDSAQVNALRQEAVPEEIRQKVILPCILNEEMAEIPLVIKNMGFNTPALCEYILQETLTVVALHEKTKLTGLWRSSLKVWSMDCLVYADSMEECAEKPCLNNFLIRGDNLYYLKEKGEIVCVVLS
ncbi:MAG: DUF4905 domain-containing protein [Chlorobium sp.]|nr:MAG: DUF4905 domain-containing protein [Chlorobium sp.]